MAEVWAKVAAGVHRNPKVRMAGRDARDVFILMLLVNAELKADGELPGYYAAPAYLADTLQCTIEEAERGLERCETFHLLQVTRELDPKTGQGGAPEVVSIVGWDTEWKVSTSTDRVRKYREKKKGNKRNVSPVSGNAETPREAREEKLEESNTLSSQPRAEGSPGELLVGVSPRPQNQAAFDVLASLNSQAARNHSPMSAETMRPILARLRGEEDEPAAKPADLELIIAHRCSLWLGTEQALFLRPSTLFGTEHFADYLDAARCWDSAGRPKRVAATPGHHKPTNLDDLPLDPLETELAPTERKPGDPF